MKRNAPLSALAQLVEMYETHCGVTSTKELSTKTGYSARSIRGAKAEINCRNQGEEQLPVTALEEAEAAIDCRTPDQERQPIAAKLEAKAAIDCRQHNPERQSNAGNTLPPGNTLPLAALNCRQWIAGGKSNAGNLSPGAATDYLAEKEKSPPTPLKEKLLPSTVTPGPDGSSRAADATEPAAPEISITDLLDRLNDAAGASLYPLSFSLQVASDPLGWLDAGCDLDRDILPVVRALGARAKPRSIRTWTYFAQAVADARDRRRRGLPPAPSAPGGAPALSDTQRTANVAQTHRSLCREFAETGKWLSHKIKLADVPLAIRAEFKLEERGVA